MKRKLEHTQHQQEVPSQVLRSEDGGSSSHSHSSAGNNNSFTATRLQESDYRLPCQELARSLIGKVLCRQSGESVLRGRVVEVESYLGSTDGASHSYKGQTERNRAMFMKPGTSYVYTIYGMYHCFNVSSEGEGAAVLVRSLQPLQGIDVIRTNREAKRKAGAKPLKEKDLCNGPSKLCQAFHIDKALNCSDLSSSPQLWFEAEPGGGEDLRLVQTTRVGIEGCGPEWSSLQLRWYLLGSSHVSVRDRAAEARLSQ